MNHVFQNEDTARSVSTILTQQCTRPLTHTPRLRPEDSHPDVSRDPPRLLGLGFAFTSRGAETNYYKLSDLKRQKCIVSKSWRPEV